MPRLAPGSASASDEDADNARADSANRYNDLGADDRIKISAFGLNCDNASITRISKVTTAPFIDANGEPIMMIYIKKVGRKGMALDRGYLRSTEQFTRIMKGEDVRMAAEKISVSTAADSGGVGAASIATPHEASTPDGAVGGHAPEAESFDGQVPAESSAADGATAAAPAPANGERSTPPVADEAPSDDGATAAAPAPVNGEHAMPSVAVEAPLDDGATAAAAADEVPSDDTRGRLDSLHTQAAKLPEVTPAILGDLRIATASEHDDCDSLVLLGSDSPFAYSELNSAKLEELASLGAELGIVSSNEGGGCVIVYRGGSLEAYNTNISLSSEFGMFFCVYDPTRRQNGAEGDVITVETPSAEVVTYDGIRRVVIARPGVVIQIGPFSVPEASAVNVFGVKNGMSPNVLSFEDMSLYTGPTNLWPAQTFRNGADGHLIRPLRNMGDTPISHRSELGLVLEPKHLAGLAGVSASDVFRTSETINLCLWQGILKSNCGALRQELVAGQWVEIAGSKATSRVQFGCLFGLAQISDADANYGRADWLPGLRPIIVAPLMVGAGEPSAGGRGACLALLSRTSVRVVPENLDKLDNVGLIVSIACVFI
jgi:hypothetical protein